uniref:Uncharacterized protein n=1 Tax=viral metagenome TaxID=1070528 RepID=A0A6C0ANU0_9ZZZZ
MSKQIDLYSQELINITVKGDCHIIQVAGKSPWDTGDKHIIIIRKEELSGIHMQGETVTFHFKTFPAILAKITGSNKKALDNLTEFMKKHLVNDTEEIDI